MAFSVLVCSQLGVVLGFRSRRRILPELGLSTNPYLLGAIVVSLLAQLSVVTLPYAKGVFETATHLGWEWCLLAALSLGPITIVEMSKLVQRWRG
jgi:P-type Ca2+ transporter type 2C